MDKARLHGRVLVVDDEEIVREVAQDLLEFDGCEVVTASDGEEALRCIHKKWPFDAILLDACLPDLSGEEVLREVKAHHAKVPVILCSGLDSSGFYVDDVSLQNIQYLKKPFGHEELYEMVRAALKQGTS